LFGALNVTWAPLIVHMLDLGWRGGFGAAETFIVAALGADADPFMLHFYAAPADKDWTLIAERTRAAAALKKAQSDDRSTQGRDRCTDAANRGAGHRACMRTACVDSLAARAVVLGAAPSGLPVAIIRIKT
jgi:hypothetical protein